jgi:hypothetical protein
MCKTTSDACVSWIEGRVPDTEEACIVHELITARCRGALDGRTILIETAT